MNICHELNMNSKLYRQFLLVPIWVERGTVRVNYLAQSNVPARVHTQTAWSGVDHSYYNHEATMPVAFGNFFLVIFDTWFDLIFHIETFDTKISEMMLQTLHTAVTWAFCLFNFIHKLFPTGRSWIPHWKFTCCGRWTHQHWWWASWLWDCRSEPTAW